MKKRYKQMIDTRRVYQLETDMYYDRRFSYITKQRSLGYLTRYAEKIWKAEKIKKQMPLIRFGKGLQKYSWCDGETLELAPTQRDVLTLIHEVVHAMGMGYHNKKFIHTEVYLLHKYTSVNTGVLLDTFEHIL